MQESNQPRGLFSRELCDNPLDPLFGVNTIVSHADCGDGILAAAIAKRTWPDANVVLVQYGTPEYVNLPATPGMIFYDISPPRERAAEFARVGAIVRDHHNSAKALRESFPNLHVFQSPGVSGAVIALHDFMASQNFQIEADAQQDTGIDIHIPSVCVEAVGCYDTWDKSCRHRFSMGETLWSGVVALGFEVVDYALRQGPQAWDLIKIAGKAAAARDELKAIRALSEAVDCGDLLLFGGTKTIANKVTELCPRDCLYAGFAVYVVGERLRVVVSLRSRSGLFRCDRIAENFGGGGHAQSAGFSKVVDSLSVMDLSADLLAALQAVTA